MAAQGRARVRGCGPGRGALVHARSRWPHLTFLCEDAARLSPEVVGRFHLVLIRQPDLWARPANWHQVFAALPPLLLPAGRVLVEVAGKGEAALAQRWLREAGLLQVGAEQAGSPTGFPPRGRGGTDTATATGGRS